MTATVTSPNGVPYAFGTGYGTLVCPGNQQPDINGSPVPRSITITGLDGFGSFTQKFYDVNVVHPTGCGYQFSITDQSTQFSFRTGSIFTVTGAGPVNLSAAISAFAVPLPVTVGAATVAGNNTFTGNNTFSGNNTHSGTETFTGPLITTRLNNVVYASGLAGADCGAKVAAAITLLGPGPGEILINNACGTSQWSAINTSQTHLGVRFVEPGTYITNSLTFSGAGSGITSDFPCPVSDPLNTANVCSVVLKQGNTLNLPALVVLNGPQDYITDVTLDGNKANNITTVGLQFKNQRQQAFRVSLQSFPGDGVQAISTGTSDQAVGAYFILSESTLNGGNGITSTNTTDIYLNRSEFELNSGWGAVWTNSASARIFANDFGGNTLGGISMTGLSTNPNLFNQFNQIEHNSFGNNNGPDIKIIGWDGVGIGSQQNQFIGNLSAGVNAAGPTDNYHDEDSVDDLWIGNLVRANLTGNTNNGITYIKNFATNVTGIIALNSITGTFAGKPININSTVNLAGNDENGSGFLTYTNATFLNNANVNVKNAAGTVQPIWTPLNGGNDSVFNNVNANRNWFFQVASATVLQFNPSLFQYNGNNVIINGPVSAGLQVKRSVAGCATAASLNANCSTTITWPSAFADGNYTVNGCTGFVVTSGVPFIQGISAKVGASITVVTVSASAAAAQYTTIECTAVHD